MPPNNVRQYNRYYCRSAVKGLSPLAANATSSHCSSVVAAGAAVALSDGVPAILYTGVKKKPDAGEREGMPMTVNRLCFERQLIARPADPSR